MEKHMKLPKAKQLFTSYMSSRTIRVRSVTVNLADKRHSLVEVATLNTKNRVIKSSIRTIYADSIRRWYITD